MTITPGSCLIEPPIAPFLIQVQRHSSTSSPLFLYYTCCQTFGFTASLLVLWIWVLVYVGVCLPELDWIASVKYVAAKAQENLKCFIISYHIKKHIHTVWIDVGCFCLKDREWKRYENETAIQQRICCDGEMTCKYRNNNTDNKWTVEEYLTVFVAFVMYSKRLNPKKKKDRKKEFCLKLPWLVHSAWMRWCLPRVPGHCASSVGAAPPLTDDQVVNHWSEQINSQHVHLLATLSVSPSVCVCAYPVRSHQRSPSAHTRWLPSASCRLTRSTAPCVGECCMYAWAWWE